MLTLNEIGSYRKYADFESVERGEVGRQTQCVVVVRGMTMIILHAYYRLIFTSASKSMGGVAFTDVFIAFLANLVLRFIADFVGSLLPAKNALTRSLSGQSAMRWPGFPHRKHAWGVAVVPGTVPGPFPLRDFPLPGCFSSPLVTINAEWAACVVGRTPICCCVCCVLDVRNSTPLYFVIPATAASNVFG